MNSKKACYIAMSFLVFIWGLDYIVAKTALHVLAPLTLVFFKYGIALIILMSIKLIRDRRFLFSKTDIPIFFLCSLFGEILYYYGEYSAIGYLPVSNVTIILAFVPMLSIFLEWIIYRRKPSAGMILGIMTCIVGITLVIGADYRELLQGKAVGYLLAFTAVVSWNIYNFLTAKLTRGYDSLTLLAWQMICTLILTAPFMLRNLPDPAVITGAVMGQVLYLGVVSASIGFMIYVKSISIIGETPCALYSNFMPVTATLFSWLLLGESITPLQMLGGVIVIASGYFVIRQKDKKERLQAQQLEQEQNHALKAHPVESR